MPRRRQTRTSRLNDDGGVKGPSSALTSFLREQGISAESVRLRYEENVRREQEMLERGRQISAEQNENDQESSTNTQSAEIELPENELDSDEEVFEGDEDNEEIAMIREKARRKRRRAESGDNDDDFPNGVGAENGNNNIDGDVGKNYCLECDKEFIISVYSKKMEKYGRVGYLCPSCTKMAIRQERLARRKEIDARKKRKLVAAALLDKQTYRLPTLQDFCIKIITDNIDDVSVLGDIGLRNKKRISRILAKNRSLNSKTMELFLDPSLKDLEFWDCSRIDKGALDKIPSYCPKLESLTLNMCGQLHKDNLLYYGQKCSNLRSLSLNGPFLINNAVWQEFFDSPVGKNLKAFHLRNTHRFTSDSLIALLDNTGSNLEKLTLNRLDGLDSKPVYDLLPHYLHNIRYLEISYPHTKDLIDDDMIVNLLATNGDHIETLILDGCSGLTDQFLISGIKPFCPVLTKLSLQQLQLITDNGITQLFSDWSINGGLMDLNLTRCLQLTDMSIYTALNHSCRTLVELTLNSVKLITKKLFLKLSRGTRFPLLTSLDIGFVRSVDDSVLAIWSRIAPNLTIMEVYGDSRCTDKAMIRHDLKVIGRETDTI